MIQRINNKQKGLRFDGVNDYIQTNFSHNFNNDFSISVRYKLGTKSTKTLFAIGVGGVNRIQVENFGGDLTKWRILFSSSNNVQFFLNQTLNTDVSLLTLVKNGNLWSFYADGNFINSFTYAYTNTLSTLRFATDSAISDFLDGNIYDCKIYNRAISGGEVTQLLNRIPVTVGLVADYRFDNQSGTTLTDYVSGNNGTLTNYTITETSIGNTNKWVYDYGSDPFDNKRKTGVIPQKGLRFDGVNDYVSTTLSIDISQNHSFSFWYKPTSRTANQRICNNYTNISTSGFVLSPSTFPNGTNLGFYFGLYSTTMGIDNCSIYTTNSIPNALMHVVVVKDTQVRANWKIYINGVEVGVTTYGTNNIASGVMTGGNIQIGAQLDPTPRFHLNADLYDLKIFNKTLSQLEVSQLYNKGAIPSNCIADYRFDNRSGTILTDYISLNNGTLTNYTTQDVTVGSTNKWLYEDGLAFDDTRNGGIVSTNDTHGLLFDGVNEHIETISTINITTQTNTVSMLCRLNSVSDTVFYVNSESGNGIFAYIQSSQIVIQRGRGGTSGDARFNTSLNTSTVYHFVFVYNSDLTMDLYINGVLQSRASQTLTGSCISNLTLKIGKTTVGVPHFGGIIYDFKLFNKSLTQSEILGIYDSRCNQIPISAISNNIVNYSFNQTQGTVLIDTSGFSRNANLINYTVAETTPGVGNKWVTGGSPTNNKILRNISHNIGNGLRFDGINDYVTINHSSQYNFGTGSFSTSVLINPAALHVGVFFVKGNINEANKGFEFYLLNNGAIGFTLLNGGNQYCFIRTDTFRYTANTSYHIVMQRNGNSAEIYVNGVIQTTNITFLGGITNINSINIDNNINPLIGLENVINPTLYLYTGIINDLKVFSKALTQTEVTGLFNSRNNIIPISAIPNVVANYNFNQKQGTTLIDGSGNNLNGTLTNYTTPETTPGVNNKWVDSSGNSILL